MKVKPKGKKVNIKVTGSRYSTQNPIVESFNLMIQFFSGNAKKIPGWYSQNFF
jgi:hypothetical protein